MVGAGLVDGLRLRALSEVRVGQTLGEAVAFLFGGGSAFREPFALRGKVDDPLQRQCKGRFVDDNLSRSLAGKCGELDRVQTRQSRL